MSRTVKRVPLDFDWPQRKVWEGYQAPEGTYPPACATCGGRGTTTARQWVEQVAMLALLLSDDVRYQSQGRDLHPYLRDSGSIAWGTRPSPDIIEFTTGLAGRAPCFIGHDALDRWTATGKLIAAAGLPATWGCCEACEGHGDVESYPGQREAAWSWEPSEPPSGDGWQLWETVSEGSPASPVFATADELAAWCETGATWFGSMTWTKDEWLASFNAGTTDTDSMLIVGVKS